MTKNTGKVVDDTRVDDTQNAEQVIEEVESAEVQNEELGNTQEEAEGNEEAVEEAAVEREPHNQINIRELRRDRDDLSRKYQEQLRENNELKLAKLAKSEEAQRVEQEPEINPDDFVEGKHLKKLINEVKDLRQKLNYQEKLSTEAALKIAYPDIENVVTEENVNILIGKNPRYKKMILDGKNEHEQYSIAYELIRDTGVSKKLSPQSLPARKASVEEERMQNNLKKPIPSGALSSKGKTSPLHYADIFASIDDPEERAEAIRKKARMYANRVE